MTNIKIFGERNTSTNAVKALIETNSATRVLASSSNEVTGFVKPLARAIRYATGRPDAKEQLHDFLHRFARTQHVWKHIAPKSDWATKFSAIPVVFCVRHPASWLLGLFRRPHNAVVPLPPSFSDFLTMKWQTLSRDGLDRRVVTPIELYNLKLQSYLAFEPAHHAQGGRNVFVRFEDFAIDQRKVFGGIAPLLEKPTDDFKPILASTKDSTKDADYYRRYYGDELWRGEIDKESWSRITAGVEWAAVSRFEYLPETGRMQ